MNGTTGQAGVHCARIPSGLSKAVRSLVIRVIVAIIIKLNLPAIVPENGREMIGILVGWDTAGHGMGAIFMGAAWNDQNDEKQQEGIC
jgi:hypothetical protein